MDRVDCPSCGESFPSKRKLQVHYNRFHDKILPNQQCAECGEWFDCEYEKKYCSEACHDEAVSYEGEANPHYQGGKETTLCEICGAEFEYYPSEKEGLYCPECVENAEWRHRPELEGSDNPRWKGGKREFECAVCGETFERYPSNATGEIAVCSESCRREWLSAEFTGEGHPNWAGGGMGNYGEGWNATRNAALERDDHTCVLCGTDAEDLGRNPDVHHIVPVRVFSEAPSHDRTDAHDVDNVVTLCPGCHRRAEFGTVARNRLRRAIGAR